MPKKYISARPSDFDHAMPSVNELGLFITGPVGVGKTHLAAAVLAEIIPSFITVHTVGSRPPGGEWYELRRCITVDALWVSTSKLFMRLKKTFEERPAESEASIQESLIAPKLLVLDDFGSEKVSDWSGTFLYTVISERINERRLTIVTTNLLLGEIHVMEPKNGPRIASRLASMASHEMQGPDRRIDIGNAA
jgi:DNA replication protein DnaC